MDVAEAGQVSTEAAEVYERFFVPALFGQFAPLVAEAAGAEPGQKSLDVACGTGVLAREMHRRRAGEAPARPASTATRACWRSPAGPSPRSTGWKARPRPCRSRTMASMPWSASSGSCTSRTAEPRCERCGVCCGRAATWSWLSGIPSATCPVSRRWRRCSDSNWARRRPRRCARRSCSATGPRWARLIEAAKIADGKIETRHGTARFRSIEDWVRTEVKGWTLADRVDDVGYQRLQQSAQERLRDFTDSDGSVAFPVAAHFVVARKPR